VIEPEHEIEQVAKDAMAERLAWSWPGRRGLHGERDQRHHQRPARVAQRLRRDATEGEEAVANIAARCATSPAP